uniref:Uncharacterized protein n=1 Tax=Palpitomonas bilix TaxID=652834 RepID=A0A7S3FYT1_9EUKA|mmetsp:Transcript_11555/g.30759  ORF Transcript_11555/g.30759 Transcript_11555/m.30759 type:complete len:485 (+) Transcript_11555:349-1803(+)
MKREREREERENKRARGKTEEETSVLPPSFNVEFPGLQKETLTTDEFRGLENRETVLQWLYQLTLRGLRHEKVWPSLEKQPLVKDLNIHEFLDAHKCDIHRLPKQEIEARELYFKKWSFYTKEKDFDFARDPAVRASHLLVFTVCKMAVDVVDFAFLEETNWSHHMDVALRKAMNRPEKEDEGDEEDKRTSQERLSLLLDDSVVAAYGEFQQDGTMREDAKDFPLTHASLGWCIRNIAISCLAPTSIMTHQVTIVSTFPTEKWNELFDSLFQVSVPSEIEVCHERCPLHRRQGLGSPLLLMLGEAFFSRHNQLSCMWTFDEIEQVTAHGRLYVHWYGMANAGWTNQLEDPETVFDRMIEFDGQEDEETEPQEPVDDCTEEERERQEEMELEKMRDWGERICFTLAHLHISPSLKMLFEFVKSVNLKEDNREDPKTRTEGEKKYAAATRRFMKKVKWLGLQKHALFFHHKMRGYEVKHVLSPVKA